LTLQKVSSGVPQYGFYVDGRDGQKRVTLIEWIVNLPSSSSNLGMASNQGYSWMKKTATHSKKSLLSCPFQISYYALIDFSLTKL
jgi:hypothetical protein